VEHTGVGHRKEDRPAQLAPDWTPPVLDDMHVHRLQLEYPNLYERLEKLAGAPAQAGGRVMFPLTQALMRELRQVQEYPKELQAVWAAVEMGRDPDPVLWESFRAKCGEHFIGVGAKRPGGFDDDHRPDEIPAQLHAYYRDHWIVARAMEHLAGWGRDRLPLADMAYAAAAARVGDIGAVLKPNLLEIEDELARERRP
jgi:hypothetical protein